MDFKFSVQIISRENTNFGRILFQALLGDLFYSKVVNELIIIDNGNAPYVKNMLKEAKSTFE
ncbi:MAG TPA: hypothetical protein VNX68_03835, partial [Nitrosopumilaceae archaeon]|nr:hypothetical protein [Nitrosopumilaceae archaeon]